MSCSSSDSTTLSSPGNSITSSTNSSCHTSGFSNCDSSDVQTNMQTKLVDELRILQWNIRGIVSNSDSFYNQTIQNAPNICMLQELSTKYIKNFHIKNFKTWSYFGDSYAKTGIYIKHYLNHGFIPIKLNIPISGNVKDILYCSAAWVEVKYQNLDYLIPFLNEINERPLWRYDFDLEWNNCGIIYMTLTNIIWSRCLVRFTSLPIIS